MGAIHRVLALAGQITFAWDASPDADLVGYRVYYGTSSGTYLQSPGAGIDVGNVLTKLVTGLTRGVTYFFAVTAYDSQGLEGDYSAEVSIVCP